MPDDDAPQHAGELAKQTRGGDARERTPPEIWTMILVMHMPDAYRWVARTVCRMWRDVIDEHNRRNPDGPLAAKTSYLRRHRTRQRIKAAACVFAEEGNLACLAYASNEWKVPAGPAIYKRAARSGNLEMLEWLLARALMPDPACIFLGAAEAGHVHVFEWLHERGYQRHDETPLFRGVSRVGRIAAAAAADGHIAVLRYMEQQDRREAEQKADHGNTDNNDEDNHDDDDDDEEEEEERGGAVGPCRTQTERQHGARSYRPLWSGSTCAAAITGGHRGVVEWLLERGCVCDQSCCIAAAQRGDIDMLQWIIDRACVAINDGLLRDAKGNRMAALAQASRSSFVGRADLCVARLKVLTRQICSRAARHGHLALLDGLVGMHGWVLPIGMCAREAASGGHVHVLERLVASERWARMSAHKRDTKRQQIGVEALRSGHICVLRWLLESHQRTVGAPRSPPAPLIKSAEVRPSRRQTQQTKRARTASATGTAAHSGDPHSGSGGADDMAWCLPHLPLFWRQGIVRSACERAIEKGHMDMLNWIMQHSGVPCNFVCKLLNCATQTHHAPKRLSPEVVEWAMCRAGVRPERVLRWAVRSRDSGLLACAVELGARWTADLWSHVLVCKRSSERAQMAAWLHLRHGIALPADPDVASRLRRLLDKASARSSAADERDGDDGQPDDDSDSDSDEHDHGGCGGY